MTTTTPLQDLDCVSELLEFKESMCEPQEFKESLCELLNNSLLPLQLNPLAWGWGAKDGLFWAGITLLCVIWCIFRLPESKDRSYAELNLLFENRVPAWKFRTTKVDAFRSESFRVQRVSSESERSEATLAAEEAVKNVKGEKQDV